MSLASVSPTISPARITARGLALAAAVWLLYTLVYAAATALFAGIPFRYAMSSQAMHSGLMALLSVPIWWVLVRELAEAPLATRMVAHVIGVVLYTGGVVGLFLGMVRMGSEIAYQSVLPQAGWIALMTAIAYVAQFGIYHAVEATRRSRERKRQAEALRHLSREQELRTLRAQLNPHFLFNALNTISADVGRDPDHAREAIGQLGGLLRYALDAGRRDLVPLADEITFVRDYLDLEQARMGDRLQVSIDIDPDALSASVPPMAVQTLVENAVRHGLAPARDGGTLTVSVAVVDEGVDVHVEDTGIGAIGPLGDGIGLANTDERLRLLFGADSTLRIDADRPVGFAVSFRLPLPEPASSAREPQLA
ncbi:MAG: histidine kinase [Bacteroidota bacterium]